MASSKRPDTPMLSDALRIAETALRICVVKGMDPFGAVRQAAEDLCLVDTPAYERVIEELSEAGTVAKGRGGGGELFAALADQLRREMGRGR